MTKISVIIPVKNGERTIGKCVDSVLALDWPDFEVIAVNDGSSDSTGEILKKYGPKIKVITTAGVGPSNARNLAVKEAKGEFIASTDGDCIVDRGWLKELYSGFCEDKVGGVGGSQQSPDDDTQFGKTVAHFMKTIGFVTGYIKPAGGTVSGKDCKPELKDVEHNPTCNVMYRKKIFDELGGFYPGLWPGEDVEFDRKVSKAGWCLLYNPFAAVYHYRTPDIGGFSRMMYSYGRVQSWLVRKFGFFRKIHYVPVALAALLAGWIFLAVRWPEFALAAVFAAMLAVWLFFMKPAQSFGKSFEFMFLFAVTVIYWNKGFFADLLGLDRRVR